MRIAAPWQQKGTPLRPADMPGPRKRRTREHVIADMSVNYVERFVLRCGWTVQRITHDYGIDLLMETYNAKGEPQVGRVLFQVKATDRLRVRQRDSTVLTRLEWRDIRAWLDEPMPVILVMYDAQQDTGYWLHIQSDFANSRRMARTGVTTTQVLAPLHQVLNEAAIRHFAVLRDTVMSRIYRVFSND